MIKDLIKGLFVDGEFSVDGLIAAIKAIVNAILGFVAKEEGYDYPAAE